MSTVGAVRAARAAALAALGGDVDVIDLTRRLDERTVLWPGSSPLTIVDTESFDDGSTARVVRLAEHSGTHLDAPLHFVPGAADTAELAADSLLVAARVIDISERSQSDGTARLLPEDILGHEAAHGLIPAGCAVLLRTGWVQEPVADVASLVFPAFGIEAAGMLVDRGVVGLGVDTLGIDPGDAAGSPVHRTVTHPAGLWHLEFLTGLERVPAAGAVLFVGVPRLAGGTGFPARVLALVPRSG